jgi:hypothetical protein
MLKYIIDNYELYFYLRIELAEKVGKLSDPSISVQDEFDSCRCFIEVQSIFGSPIADESLLCIQGRDFGDK